ncbi:MAG TPA: hypothetical protein VF245_08325 [Solirubrobacterales bacterium]
MSGAWWRESRDVERFALVGLAVAMVVAAVLLLAETRGLTLLVDEWSWGYAGRTDLDLHAFVDPHNGHFVAVMVLITKAALQLFHEDAETPLRLLAVALHLAVAACLFALLRQALGALGALVPTVLFLFLGAANDGIVGSHGMSVTITVLCGLGAWLALQRRRTGWDAVAAGLLTIGVATESTVLPFVFAAALIVALDRESPRSRYWVAIAPLAVYAVWWLAWGHTEKSDVAIANFAALPSFAFDSLAASLASVTGVFTIPGSRTVGFDLAAGQALAGGMLMVLLALVLARRYRPGVASAVPMLALLSFWLLTSGVANPARQPYSSRFIYIDVVLLLLVLAQEIAASPVRRRAVPILAGICALGLSPNVRELTYAGDGARVGAEVNRAVMGAADLLAGQGEASALLEDPRDPIEGQVADLAFPLERYEASRDRFGAPALSPAQIEAADPVARVAADHFLVRALSISVVPAAGLPRPLSAPAGASQTGGVLTHARGCLRFTPLVVGAQMTLRLPLGGLWLRPAAGPPVPISVARFAEGPAGGVGVGPALGGRASRLDLPRSRASRGWSAQLVPDQRLLICGA